MQTRRLTLVLFALVAGCNFSVEGLAPVTGGGGSPPPPGSTGSPPAAAPADGGGAGSDAGPIGDDSGTVTPTAVAPQPGSIGTACDGAHPCNGSLTCVTSAGGGPGQAPTQFPGGYCTTDCAKGSCGAGAQCATFQKDSICLASCAGGCRSGYVCCGGFASGACVPGTTCGGE